MTIEYKDSKRIVLNEADRTLIQGYAGGGGGSGATYPSGGGGGSGSVGQDGSGGNGGAGTSSSITGGSPVTRAGGGGGADDVSNGSGSAGGGDGTSSGGASISDADANSGSGGGSCGSQAGDGGSGIVIIRFTTSGNGYNTPTGTHSIDTSVLGQTIISWTAGTGTFTPTSTFNVQYLVIAGGGGAGVYYGGGGGAGGYLTSTSHEVTAQEYTITVGAGGAGSTTMGGGAGSNGSDSSIVPVSGTSIISTGGGAGYGQGTGSGLSGGSGGGSRVTSSGGAGTSSDITPTDVQDNSILVETDTARRYWFNSVTATNSANFDVSSNDHIDIPTTGLTSLANGSVSFWLNLATDTTNTGDNVVFSGSNSSTGSSEWIIGYYGSTNKISVLSRNSGSNVLEYKAGTLTKGTWHHIVYTNNSSTGNKLYIDGSVVTPSYTQGSASTNSFMSAVSSINTCTIGSNKDSGGYQWSWDGNIQQVLVYGSTLTSSEVTALYNSGDYNSSPSTTNLLRRYELRVDANDTSGNGHNGTSTGVTFTATTIPNTPSTTTTTWTRELPTLPTISDLVLHLDANASSTITKDGNLVATWGDGSTVSNDITASGTARPTWVDDTQTGLPVIRFDGTNNIMTGTTASYSLPNTLFMVCTTPNTDSEGMFDGDTSRNLFNRQGTNTYRIYAGAGVTGGTANTAMQVFTVVFNNGSPALNINGSAQSLSGTNIGTSALDDIVLGAFDGNTGNADYDVCEVLFYNKALSTSEISSVESYLNKKWGVY